MPKPEDSIIYRKRRKGQDVAGYDIGPGGEPKAIDPAKLEQRREHQRRLRETEKFNRETGRICMSCGKVLSGPHKDEIGGPEAGASHQYKGHKYSGAYCDDCRPKEVSDFRAEYMRYRREHPKEDEG